VGHSPTSSGLADIVTWRKKNWQRRGGKKRGELRQMAAIAATEDLSKIQRRGGLREDSERKRTQRGISGSDFVTSITTHSVKKEVEEKRV